MVLYIVLPCYNEEEVLPLTAAKLSEKLGLMIAGGKVSPESRMLFVDDGSSDNTWGILKELTDKSPLFTAIKLSRNKGHQNALIAGLFRAMEHCDAAISMDADLQDDINAIDECVEKYKEGCDIVYCVRKDRSSDTFFKRNTALAFYKLMRWFGVESVNNHADYRLMSRRAIEALNNYKEVNLFLRGIIPLIGYKHDYVYYNRNERAAGKSKYPLKKMLSFAVDGITSFSISPLKFISRLGLFVALLSILGIAYALFSKLFSDDTVAGWTAIVASIWLLGGIQLLCLGIVGEYIGKIYSEVKERPRYIISEEIGIESDKRVKY